MRSNPGGIVMLDVPVSAPRAGRSFVHLLIRGFDAFKTRLRARRCICRPRSTHGRPPISVSLSLSLYLSIFVSLHGILFLSVAVSTIERQCSREAVLIHDLLFLPISTIESGVS